MLHWSRFEVTADAPYPTLTAEVWGIYSGFGSLTKWRTAVSLFLIMFIYALKYIWMPHNNIISLPLSLSSLSLLFSLFYLFSLYLSISKFCNWNVSYEGRGILLFFNSLSIYMVICFPWQLFLNSLEMLDFHLIKLDISKIYMIDIMWVWSYFQVEYYGKFLCLHLIFTEPTENPPRFWQSQISILIDKGFQLSYRHESTIHFHVLGNQVVHFILLAIVVIPNISK